MDLSGAAEQNLRFWGPFVNDLRTFALNLHLLIGCLDDLRSFDVAQIATFANMFETVFTQKSLKLCAEHKRQILTITIYTAIERSMHKKDYQSRSSSSQFQMHIKMRDSICQIHLTNNILPLSHLLFVNLKFPIS